MPGEISPSTILLNIAKSSRTAMAEAFSFSEICEIKRSLRVLGKK